MRIVRVALDVPISRFFDYTEAHASRADVGRRVIVQFGRRKSVGVIADVADSTEVPSGQLKPVDTVLRDAPGFDADDLRLLQFAADYYHYPLGQVFAAALPQRLRRVREPRARKTSPRIKAEAGVKKSPTPTPELTPAQSAAVEAVAANLGGFHPFLVLGVTGSGKTEVYLRAAERVIDAGRQVLFLVPEIALTPQLEATVRARFAGVNLVSLHSGLSETERLRHWLAAQAGTAQIVLGTRLAVFTPLPKLGLIVVDEEHDASLKQTEGFCYSARDLAVVRAQQRCVPIILGSATPALESYHNAVNGRYTLLELPERVNALAPTIECVPLQRSAAAEGVSGRVLEVVRERVARGEQALVFINRRGYAPVLMCHSCGWLSGCHRCSAQLVLHLPARELHCHHCGHRERVPGACPECGDPALKPLGQGTQRVEEALAASLPGARVLRIDRDTTRRRHAWHDMRELIHAGEVDVLVGTQILAKGHDFPNLALVVILNADAMLYSADFRASERLFALLTQVAGRAGRRQAQGEVLVQTEFPEHGLYAAFRAQDYGRFAENELRHRAEAGFPPFVYQALLRAEARELPTALAFLEHARSIAGPTTDGIQLFDPVPATMVRLAGRERAQLLVQSRLRSELHAFLRSWREALTLDKSHSARWLLEVDPVEL